MAIRNAAIFLSVMQVSLLASCSLDTYGLDSASGVCPAGQLGCSCALQAGADLLVGREGICADMQSPTGSGAPTELSADMSDPSGTTGLSGTTGAPGTTAASGTTAEESSTGSEVILCDDGEVALGELCFSPSSPLEMGSAPFAVAVADFNKDTHLDIVSANVESNNVTIRTGTGDGAFNALSALATGMSPYALATPDINDDLAPDLVVVNSYGNDMSIYLNDGVGMLIGQSALAVGTSPKSVTVADVNADTHDDVIVGNNGAATLAVFLGDGQSFSMPTVISSGDGPTGVAAADVNSDGKLDVIGAANGASTLGVSLGNGVGNFGPPSFSAISGGAYALGVAEFDSEPGIDVVVTVQNYSEIYFLKGLDNGSFAGAIPYPCGVYPHGLAVEDMNGDGNLDVVVTNYATEGAVSVLLGDGAGGFSAPTSFTVGAYPMALDIGDFNEDGVPDVVTATSGGSTVSVLLSSP